MDMISWRRERLASHGGSRGRGLEIGAFVRPTFHDLGLEMYYLDFYSTEEMRQHANQIGADLKNLVNVDFVARGEDYRPYVDRSFDFIVANHVMEHIIDVVSWLKMLGDMLNEGGHLLLTLPDKKYNFDKFRDDTTIAHLLADYYSDAPLSALAQIHTIETHIFYDRGYVGQVARAEDVFCPETLAREISQHHPGVHCHVFQGETFLQKILKPLLFTGILDFSLVEYIEKSPFGEFSIVLKKGREAFDYSMEEFYAAYRTGP